MALTSNGREDLTPHLERTLSSKLGYIAFQTTSCLMLNYREWAGLVFVITLN